MIYVFESTYFNKFDKSIIDLIKIGYTDNWRKRIDQYKLHNPGIKVLFIYSEGTEEDEKSLHQLFNNYKYPDYGNEWFNYSDDIINFFKNNTTIKDVRKYFKPKKLSAGNLSGAERKTRRRLIYQYSYFASTLISNKTSYDFRKLLLSCDDIIKLEDIQNWFKQNYPSEFSEIDKLYSNFLQISNQDNNKVKEFFRIFEQLPSFSKKLKYLCESELDPTFIKTKIIPAISEPHFDEYYNVLGPERCKSLSYDTSRLRKDLSVMAFSTEILTTEVYKEFKEGQKVSRANVKQKLQSIYDLVGYSKKAKASDLEEYFEVRNTTVSDPVRTNGFELIKRLK